MNRIHFNRAKTLASHIVLAMGLTALAACGGGGGGGGSKSSSSSSSVAPDTTPDDFSFTSQTDVTRGDAIISNTVTIAGIDAVTPVSITNGEYAIGDAVEFVTTAGSITVGQAIKVRVTAPGGFDETQAAELNVGGVKATFSVTTEKLDTEPKAFTFNPEINAAFDSEHTSGEIEIEEINDTAEISITNGFYSVNGGAFTDAMGTVELTDKVKVKGIAASKTDTTKDVTLTIGGVSGIFSITTFSDTTAPTAKIAFPPPVSKTQSDSVIVRGTVQDDYNEIDSIKIFVNGNESDYMVTLENADGFIRWSAETNLNVGDNNVNVVVSDSVGNEDLEAATVYIRHESFDQPFPNNDVKFNSANDVLVYKFQNTYKVLTSSTSIPEKLIRTDLSTGVREEIQISNIPEGLSTYSSMAIDRSSGELYLVHPDYDGGEQGIVKVNVNSWSVEGYIRIPDLLGYAIAGLAVDASSYDGRLLFGAFDNNEISKVDAALENYQLFSSNTTPNADYPFAYPHAVKVNPITNEIYALNAFSPNLYGLNSENGSRVLISGDDQVTEDVKNWSKSIAMDFDIYGAQNRVIVAGEDQNTLLAIDLADGSRSLFPFNWSVPIQYAVGVATHPDLEYVLVQDAWLNNILAVDLLNGQRVVVTKSN